MLSDEYDDGIKPGASCFAACMLSAMQERDWERVLDLDRKMIDAGLPPDPVSFKGVILASCRLKRSVRAAEAIEAAVDAELPMNREEFDLCAGLLLPTISDDAGDMREISMRLRAFAREHEAFATEALELDRMLSCAATEEVRKYTDKVGSRKRAESWRLAMKGLLGLSQAITQ